jgi:hypothetical protein
MTWGSQNGNSASGSCLLEQELSISVRGGIPRVHFRPYCFLHGPLELICFTHFLPPSLSSLCGLILSPEKFFQVLQANQGTIPSNLYLKGKRLFQSFARLASLFVGTHVIFHSGSHGCPCLPAHLSSDIRSLAHGTVYTMSHWDPCLHTLLLPPV